MLGINGKFRLLTVLPLTQEFRIFPREMGFAFRWLEYIETQWEIKTKRSHLIVEIANFCNEFRMYQREPFHSGSESHKWLWHYEAVIPLQAKMLAYNNEEAFLDRKSICLLPEHYGKQVMDAYVNQQIKKREKEFTEVQKANVLVGTWNVAGGEPHEDLESWLKCLGSGYQTPCATPDIIVLCLQEICSLNAKNILGDESRRRDWTRFLKSEVNRAFPEGNYLLKSDQYLVGLLLVLMVKESVNPSVNEVTTSSLKLGLKGYTGNKGGVFCRFEFFDTSICVVNCHLAAHKNQVRLRNEHIRSIQKHTKFLLKGNVAKGLYEHDLILWAGDLNYRLNNISVEGILEKIGQGKVSELLVHDQLTHEKKKNQVLADFCEGEISFPPTFKHLIGSRSEYLTEKREPAWCDRVLWRGQAELTRYGSCEFNTQSDHKPVFGSFEVPIRKKNQVLLSRVKKDIFQQIDALHHQSLPKMKVSENFISFKEVIYKKEQTKHISLQNEGNTVVKFSVKNKKKGEIRSWLIVTPLSGAIIPGEILDLQLKVFFSEHQARKANKNPEYLSFIMVLSAVGGSDHFVEINCDFKSCFGNTCEDLVRVDMPLGLLPCHVKNYIATSTTELVVPQALKILTEFILQNGSNSKGLFFETGEPQTISVIRQALDFQETLDCDTVDVYSVSAVLLEFLESLAEPIVSPELIDNSCKVLESTSSFQQAKFLLYENLEKVSLECFKAVLAFLKSLLELRMLNGLNEQVLAEYFTEPISHAEELQVKGLYSNSLGIQSSQRKYLLNLFLYS